MKRSLTCFLGRVLPIVLLVPIIMLAGSAAALNTPPIANAGPDQTVFVAEVTVLQGSASDADGDPIVSWS